MSSAHDRSNSVVKFVGIRAVAVVVGFLLIAAAIMKLRSGASAQSLSFLTLSPSWLHLTVIAFELLLGGWLMSGRHAATAWLTTVLTFIGFSVVTTWSLWLGRSSCGCLGDVALHPGYALALDGAVLGMLYWTRPRPLSLRKHLVTVASIAAPSIVMLALWSGIVVALFGSTDGALREVRGIQVYAESEMLDFGTIPAGQSVSADVPIHNATGQVVQIVGGSSSCACTTLGSLPLEIPAGESRSVVVWLKAPSEQGVFEHKTFLWTATAGQQTIPISLIGRSQAP